MNSKMFSSLGGSGAPSYNGRAPFMNYIPGMTMPPRNPGPDGRFIFPPRPAPQTPAITPPPGMPAPSLNNGVPIQDPNASPGGVGGTPSGGTTGGDAPPGAGGDDW